MSIQQQLFEGTLIHLGAIDYDKDPEVESRWTHDAAYLRSIGMEAARPLAPAQVKKKYEAIEKQMDESKNSFYFAIRSREPDATNNGRLLGFARLEWIEWSHGACFFKLAIGDSQDRGKGYGSEAMRLMLRFAFDELNLYRLMVVVGEDNPTAIRFFQKFAFVEEVRRRKAILRDGKTWDLLHLGLLRSEWLESPLAASQAISGEPA